MPQFEHISNEFPPAQDQDRLYGGQSFESIYVTHGPRLTNYFRIRFGFKHAIAEELMHDTMERVIERIDTFKGPDNILINWIYTIAHNIAVSYLKKKSNRLTEPYDPELIEANGDATLLFNGSFSEATDPYASIENQETLAELQKILSPRQFRLFYAREIGLNKRELAALLNVKPSTINPMVHKARNTVAKFIVDEAA